MKPLPLTVRMKDLTRAAAGEGVMLVMGGAGFTGTVMVKLSALEVPPPGAGLKTVTEATPVLAMSAARMAAVSCVALTKLVARLTPFQSTTDPETKLLPRTVRL